MYFVKELLLRTKLSSDLVTFAWLVATPHRGSGDLARLRNRGSSPRCTSAPWSSRFAMFTKPARQLSARESACSLACSVWCRLLRRVLFNNLLQEFNLTVMEEVLMSWIFVPSGCRIVCCVCVSAPPVSNICEHHLWTCFRQKRFKATTYSKASRIVRYVLLC